MERTVYETDWYELNADGTLVIAEGVQLIGKQSFANNREIRRVFIPASVRTIGEEAFAGCIELESVEMQEGVRRLADRCFENCERLKGIKLPETVVSIRGGAFRGCIALEEMRLPAALQRNIESNTFAGCTALKKINIPPEIRHIMPGAFRDCAALSEVEFEAPEVRIAADSFRACTALSAETVRYIEQQIPPEHVLDIRSSGSGLSGRLSNFTARRFELDGVECGSIEGVLQSFKCPDAEKQKEICRLAGGAAKHAGMRYEWWVEKALYWRGVRYDRLSNAYRQLLDRLYDAVYEQDENFRRDVRAVYGMSIDHSMGHVSPQRTILTRGEFLDQLTRLSRRAAEEEKE